MTTTEAFAEVSPSYGVTRSQFNSPAVLEPHIHGSQTTHLAEDLLLTSLGSNRLSQELAHFPRVEMVDEAPDPGFSKPSQALHEVEPLTDGVVGVVVDTLLGCGLAKHVGQKGGVSAFLIGHELDEGHVLGIEASLEEFGFREAGEPVMEQVELDPFLESNVSRAPRTHSTRISNLV